LIYLIFDIYAGVRERYPESGPRLGIGGPLLRFVRASLLVIDPVLGRNVKEDQLRWRLRAWRKRKVEA
jgi:hypothetical protein